MNRRQILLSIPIVLLGNHLVKQAAASSGKQERNMCDDDISKPIPAQKPACPVITEKWDLWRIATCLRGANIWQARVTPDDGMGPGPVGPPYLSNDLPELAAWGANYVNISHPGIFNEIAEANPKYHFDQPVFDNLDQLIERCDRAGMFAVVAFRTGPGRAEEVFDGNKLAPMWNSPEARDAWVNMWYEAALRFKDKKNVIGYDLMVEPETKDHKMWNELAGRIITAIRRVDSKTPILFEAADWSTVDSLPCAGQFDDSKIVYAVHQYEPFSYTHQKQNAHKPYPGGLESLYERINAFKDHRRVVIAVNEFGVMRWSPGASPFLERQIDLIERIGAGHALWLWETSFPINYDEFNYRHASNDLINTIKRSWGHNRIQLRDVKSKF
jgi:Cellulase (glycosyl hydrolase family 5)